MNALDTVRVEQRESVAESVRTPNLTTCFLDTVFAQGSGSIAGSLGFFRHLTPDCPTRSIKLV